jgi:hypothetical protein
MLFQRWRAVAAPYVQRRMSLLIDQSPGGLPEKIEFKKAE